LIAMLRYLYEKRLMRQISPYPVPSCVAIVISSGDLDGAGLDNLREVIGWMGPLGVKSLLIYIAEDRPELEAALMRGLAEIPARIHIHRRRGKVLKSDGLGMDVIISLGYGGKQEVTEAITNILVKVERGLIEPQEIDEKMIEANLRFRFKPDLVIRAGGRQLSDFMIWQAAYSELYFTEVNWNSIRRIDLLRAIRDYQARERRYGR